MVSISLCLPQADASPSHSVILSEHFNNGPKHRKAATKWPRALAPHGTPRTCSWGLCPEQAELMVGAGD